jgi:hypothetical protein
MSASTTPGKLLIGVRPVYTESGEPWYVKPAIADAKRRVNSQLNMVRELLQYVITLEGAEQLNKMEQDVALLCMEWRTKLMGGRRV